MEGFTTYAPYIAAIAGVAFGASSLMLTRMKDMKMRIKFFDFASKEIDEALVSADRVLKNGATPVVVRRAILVVLEALASPEMGKELALDYYSVAEAKAKAPGKENPLSEALDKLHITNPKLAADAHRAIMGVMLALPVMHADKINVLEVAGETATNPSSVFDKIAKIISRINGDGRGGSNRGALAAC